MTSSTEKAHTDFSVADVGGVAVSQAAGTEPAGVSRGKSLWASAWGELRRSPLFWISAALILLFVTMAAFPQLFTSTDPTSADLAKAREKPSLSGGLFGYDSQGYDVYARTIYGARASILVGILATIATSLLGGALGLIAGYRGGWLDAVLARVGEIFFALPLLLGGILFLFTFPNALNTPLIVQVLKIVAFIALLGWPQIARLMRSSVLQIKPNDYVQAARALGAGNTRILLGHILPNALAPVIVVSTINLGAYIATEATLSFLSIGLQPPAVSWGIAISDASAIGLIRVAPHMLLFPSIFLSLTVLAFIMLGDAVRDALDPKLR
jgi:oligopeptide transport system permease protein